MVFLLAIAGASSVLLMPGILILIENTLSLNASELGWVASSDLFFSGLTMLVLVFHIHRMDLKTAAAISLLLLILGSLCSALSTSFEQLISARAVAGVGSGGAMSIAFARFARSSNPEREFGIYLFLAPMFSAVGLFLLGLLEGDMGMRVAFAAIVALAGVAEGILFKSAWQQDQYSHERKPPALPQHSLSVIAFGLAGVSFFVAQVEYGPTSVT